MKPYLRVTVWYAALGILWIIASDSLLHLASSDAARVAQLQSIKGAIYVLLSTALIYHLTRKAFLREQAEEAQRREVFNKTLSRTYHILFNYLNQMELVSMEAERCDDFDPETVALARRISGEATEELMKLNRITDITPAQIEAMTAGRGGF